MANLSTSTITALNGTVLVNQLDNFGTSGIIVTGTWIGTISFEGSLDGVNYVSVLAMRISDSFFVSSTTSNGQFLVNVSGMQFLRARMSSFTSGTANVTIQGNAAVSISRALSTIAGATDGTRIGNTSDRLKVDTVITPSSGSIPSTSSKLRYDDMNVSTGGVARNTLVTNSAWTTVYNYSGSGILFSALINLENKNKWEVRITVDGEEIFGSAGLSTKDLVDDSVYDLDDAGSPLSPNEGNFGLSLEEHDRFVWNCPNSFPVRFTSNVTIRLKRIALEASKKFKAGLVIITRET